jgi:hypothetical protein
MCASSLKEEGNIMRIENIVASLSLLALPLASLAQAQPDDVISVPEPETFALLAGAAAAWAIVRWIKRR